MKKKPDRPNKQSTPKDTPATRRRRLQQRLKEMSAQNEREMSALMKSVERIKSTFRSKKPKKSNNSSERTARN